MGKLCLNTITVEIRQWLTLVERFKIVYQRFHNTEPRHLTEGKEKQIIIQEEISFFSVQIVLQFIDDLRALSVQIKKQFLAETYCLIYRDTKAVVKKMSFYLIKTKLLKII